MEKVIDLVAGARPNFMKLAAVVRALQAISKEREISDCVWRNVHTGQHYDPGMNEVFFEQLGIPQPDVHLEVGSGTHGVQTARILERYEAHLLERGAVATVVFGDVNSTAACALAAVKLGLPVVHVEAGLRSFDRSMPEEINRVVTDILSEMLLVSEPSGIENLKREGIANGKVYYVGNVMIDTLTRELPQALNLELQRELGLRNGEYGLVTLHRPSNVDDPQILKGILELLLQMSEKIPLVFPVHPRTRKAIDTNGFTEMLSGAPGLKYIDPLPYHHNLCLMARAKIVLTDSGGMQEETSYLKVPCLTLRDNTERPITLTLGTSRLVGNDPARIGSAFNEVLSGDWPKGEDIPLWDGKAAERIVQVISNYKF
jgi:UDP-N-acetylglucosamine 2-epimerase (non-hydrolysing)